MTGKKRTRVSGLGVRMNGVSVDPAVNELLKNAVENKAALTAKQRRDRKRQKVTYDMDPAVQSALQHAAKREDTSSSQLAMLLLAFALHAYANKDEALLAALDTKTPARTPRFSWNLDIPNGWLETIENMQKEPKKRSGWGI